MSKLENAYRMLENAENRMRFANTDHTTVKAMNEVARLRRLVRKFQMEDHG